MKKIILILLFFTGFLQAQTYQNPTFGVITEKNNLEDNSATKVKVQDVNGKSGWVNKSVFQTTITNPVTGTGTSNYIPKWSTSSSLSNSAIYQSGTNIGIGTTSPQSAFHLADANAIYLDRYQNGDAVLKPNIFLRNFGGTFSSPTALPVNAPIGAFAMSAGYTTSSTTGQPPNIQILGYAKGTQSVSAHGGQIQMRVVRPETLFDETVLDLEADSVKLVPEDNDAITTVGLPAPQVGLEGSHKFQVVGRTGHPTVSFGNYGTNAGFHGWASRGTYAAPTKLLSGDALFSFGFRGWGDTGLQGSSGSMTVYATENFTDTAQGTRVIIQTNANGHNATLLGRTSTFEFGQDGIFTIPALKINAQLNQIAPLRFDTGTLVTTPQAGAFEYNSNKLYFTPNATREEVAYKSDLNNYVLKAGDVMTGALSTTKLGVGASGSTVNVGIFNTANITGATTSYANYISANVQSGVTVSAYGNRTMIGTQAASFNLPILNHYGAAQGTIGAGSSVTVQNGFIAESTLINASTLNTGFRGSIPAGSGRFNTYMDGTALNYFNGSVLLGSTTDNGIAQLQVTGNVSSTSTPTNAAHLTRKDYVDGLVRPYKVYTALISQTGTSAPTATVLENSLGGTVTFSRTVAGNYLATLTGAFTISKTACFITATTGTFVHQAVRNSTNDVTIVTLNNSNIATDSLLNNTTFEVRVYN